MRKSLLFYSFVLFFLVYDISYSQHFIDAVPKDQQNNFYEIRAAAEKYWEGRNYKEKGKGWKQYKRWEWFWESRLNPDGTFPNTMHFYDQKVKYRSEDRTNDKTKNNVTQAASWSQVGPVSSTGGYSGLGRLNCIAVHPNNSSTMWAGAASGGLWKTTNGGSSWTTNTDGLSSIGISDIAIDPDIPYTTMYIATGDRDAGDTYSVGVLKSTDGGDSWNSTGLNWNTKQYHTIGRLRINPDNTNIILAATNTGIYRTTDAGSNWTQSKSGNFKDMEFKPGDPNVVYCSGTTVYKSTDNGVSWVPANSGLPSSGVNRVAIAVTPDNSANIYAVASKSADNGLMGVYLSTDEGSSWTEIKDDQTPNLLGWRGDGTDAGGQGWYDLCIVVSPSNENVIFVGGINIWKTSNGGTSWVPCAIWTSHPDYNPGMAYPVVHADHHDLFFIPSNSSLVSCHDGGIDVSSDFGSSWSYIGSGIKNTQIYRFGTDPSDDGHIIAGCQDVGSKLLANDTWYDVLGGDGMECIIDPNDPNIIWGELYYGDLRRSTNGGASFSSRRNGITEDGAWVTPYSMDPNNSSVLWAGYRNIYYTSDGGASWVKKTNITSGSKFQILEIAPSNSNYVIAAYSSGFNNTVRLTTNAGASWNDVYVPNGYLKDIEFDPADENKMWISYGGYNNPTVKVYYTTNGGSNWNNISGNLPDVPVNCILREAGSSADRVYIGTDIGVWYCDNNDGSWQGLNSGLPTVIINELAVNYNTNKLQAATYGRGVWEIQLQGAPQKVTLSLPGNNSTNTETDGLTLSWQTLSGASTYALQVSENSDMSSPVYDNTGVSATSQVINGLNNYIKYYWRVKGEGTGSFAWSDTWNFTTKIAAPDLTDPADGATAVSYKGGEFKWGAVSGADSYHLQVAENNTFAQAVLVIDQTNVTQGSWQYALSILEPNKTYYWRVYAVNADGPSGTSAIWSFKTRIAAPVLAEYVNNFRGAPLTGDLLWHPVEAADDYHITISPNLNMSSPVSDVSGLTDTSFSYSGLLNNKEYYWRVNASNADGDGEVSETFKFTTILADPLLTSPADKKNYLPTDGFLVWKTVDGAAAYRVQLSKIEDFSDIPVIDLDVPNDTLQAYSGLENSETYFWRVKAKDDTLESNWSDVFSFTTIFAPPVLLSPADVSVDEPKDGTLIFNSLPEAASYDLQLSTTEDFSSGIILDKPGITDTAVDYSGLEFNTAYYWRVLANTGSGESTVWSEVWQFTTVPEPGVPALTFPADKSTDISINTDLVWQQVDGADSYHVQLSKSGEFTDPIVDEEGVTDTHYQLSSLDYETEYFWRVSAKSGNDYSKWSNVWSFKTGAESIDLTAPVLVSPNNKASDIKTDGVLEWLDVDGALSYVVQVSENKQFDKTVTDQEVNTSTYDYSGLKNNTLYYWRVKAKAGSNESVWSNVWSFTTEKEVVVPEKVDLSQPLNNTDGFPDGGLLVWYGIENALSYTLDIAKDRDFENIIIDETGLTDTTWKFEGLDKGGKYYWRVKEIFSGQETGWSDTWYFIAESDLEAPQLISPADNATGVKPDGSFEWSPADGASSYNLQLSLSQDFTDINNVLVLDENGIKSTVLSFSLETNTQYYWRVSQSQDNIYGPWSEIRTFATGDMSSVGEGVSYITGFRCYPNPFDRKTYLAFTLSEPADVTLDIYDALGNKISTLANEHYDMGTYTVEWKPAGLPSGSYIATLSCCGSKRTLKIILKK